MEEDIIELAKQEWQQWRTVCTMLKKCGAVTDEDLKSLSTQTKTPGQKLLNALKIWGDLVRKMERK